MSNTSRGRAAVVAALCHAVALAAGLPWTDLAAEPTPRVEFVTEVAAYYTAAAVYLPLSAEPAPTRTGGGELELYRSLLLQSFLAPQTLLFEASVYPLPVLGTWLRRKNEQSYQDADVAGVNWIETISAGFQEPAALSMFLGNTISYVRPAEQRKGTNKGHVGYLLSVGTRHIADNVLVSDDWYELEWKLKGERDFEHDELTWSFRLGTQQHANPWVADTAYLGLRRGNLDYRASWLGWLTNSGVEMFVSLTTQDPALASSQLLFEKRLPLPRWRVALALQAGVIYESRRLYSGDLQQSGDEFIFALRPNIEF